MYCSRCGAELVGGAAFCQQCGEPVGASSSPTSQAAEPASLADWYMQPWKKYADFQGRARRKEYWTFALGNILVGFGLGVVEGLAGLSTNAEQGALGALFTLAAIVPGLAVSVRRLHDTGSSAWWLLWWLLPVIGWIVLLIAFLSDSKREANEWGPSPKYGAAPADGQVPPPPGRAPTPA